MPKKINTEFRTVMHPERSDFEIDYRSKMMFIGSCFTENIGGILKRAKFNTDINPFGILFNPVSVKNTLLNLIDRKIFREKDLFYYNERWNSFLHHGSFSGTDMNETLQEMNKRIDDSSEFLQSCDQLFITFGTAWVYEFKKTKTVVSNCHKIPASEFKKFLLKPKEIIDDYIFLHAFLKKVNPKFKFIYTLSPVRHLKDGFSENSLSKAVLRYAISELVNDCED